MQPQVRSNWPRQYMTLASSSMLGVHPWAPEHGPALAYWFAHSAFSKKEEMWCEFLLSTSPRISRDFWPTTSVTCDAAPQQSAKWWCVHPTAEAWEGGVVLWQQLQKVLVRAGMLANWGGKGKDQVNLFMSWINLFISLFANWLNTIR